MPFLGAIPLDPTICISGEVLQGKKRPHECPAFGTQCTPEHPVGAPMVSSEGACRIWHTYGGVPDLREVA